MLLLIFFFFFFFSEVHHCTKKPTNNLFYVLEFSEFDVGLFDFSDSSALGEFSAANHYFIFVNIRYLGFIYKKKIAFGKMWPV